MSIKQIKIFFDSFDRNSYPSEQYYQLFRLMFFSGLRISEATTIKISNVLWETNQILIENTKNKRQHLAVFPNHIKEELIRWIKYKSYYSDDDRLFTISHSSARQYFTKMLRSSELPRYFHPHSMRHSFAVGLLNRGTDIRKIAQLLNHKELSSTMVYTYCATRHLVEEVEKLPVV